MTVPARKDDKYLGKWRLIPELCLYQVGDVPISATYEISRESGEVVIAICWQNPDGSVHQVTFSGPDDGSRKTSEAAGVSEFSIVRISERILDSSAYSDGEEVLYARRSSSLDGKLLSTVQSGMADGVPYRNFQVYLREET